MKEQEDFILKKLSTVNIKGIERATKIPATRMYKWLKGKGFPKIADYNLLVEHFNGTYSKSQEKSENGEKYIGNENITYKENVTLKETTGRENSGFSNNNNSNNEIYTENSTYPHRDINGKIKEEPIEIKMLPSDVEKLKYILSFSQEHLPFSNATSREVQNILPLIKHIYELIN